MNLRTIATWVIYDHKNKYIVTAATTKKRGLMKLKRNPGCVLVRMKGHYFPPRGDKGE